MTHATNRATQRSDSVGVYIHVPYCRVACPYCDFVKRAIEGDAPDRFVDSLCAEIERFEGPTDVSSVFLGGGTPSLLTPSALARIFDTLHGRFHIERPEISIEVNPDDVTNELLTSWREVGINRVNLGVQSFNDDVLRYLGRCHDARCARQACEAVAGNFGNWGIDLIFGAPPTEVWEQSLSECRGFAPPHVSTYSLTFEEGTPFWRRKTEAIDEDTSLTLYRTAMESLAAYDHYEVSNFAKEGFQSLHNRIYWRNGEYIGFGPGAYSYIDGVRSRNLPKIDAYLRQPGEKIESLLLSEREICVETVIQHLRTSSGLPRQAYRERFGRNVEADFGSEIESLKARGLLESIGDVLRPTRAGYELNNEIGLALV